MSKTSCFSKSKYISVGLTERNKIQTEETVAGISAGRVYQRSVEGLKASRDLRLDNSPATKTPTTATAVAATSAAEAEPEGGQGA